MKKLFQITAIAILVSSSLMAGAVSVVQSYQAVNIGGDLAPPEYGLRLDGFIDGNVDHEVTFAFNDVRFDIYDDGSARLYGSLSLVEYDDLGNAGGFASDWDLDVALTGTGTDGTYDYYRIDGIGTLQNVNDAGDYAELVSFGPDYQVGVGANGETAAFGAAGWLNWIHYWGDDVIGNIDQHYYDSDFLMELEVLPTVPEPATLALVGLGMGAMTLLRRGKSRLGGANADEMPPLA